MRASAEARVRRIPRNVRRKANASGEQSQKATSWASVRASDFQQPASQWWGLVRSTMTGAWTLPPAGASQAQGPYRSLLHGFLLRVWQQCPRGPQKRARRRAACAARNGMHRAWAPGHKILTAASIYGFLLTSDSKARAARRSTREEGRHAPRETSCTARGLPGTRSLPLPPSMAFC